MWNEVKTVWLTEMTSHLRDRRALLAVLGFSLVGPLGAFLMVWMLERNANEDQPILLDVIGAQHAPTLVNWLERQNVEITRRGEASGPGIPSLNTAEVLLVIPADFAERFNRAVPARMRLYRDDREDRSSAASRGVSRLLREYEADVSDMRLNARGIPGHIVSPFIVDEANLAPADGGSLDFANTLLYFVIFAPFLAGIGIANEVTAGEREKSSLLPLMAQPVSPAALIAGKFLTVACFGIAGLIIAVVVQFNLLHFSPLEELGISLLLGPGAQLQIIGILLPVALAIAALQMAVALLARSFKEAQTYLSALSFLPVGLAMYATLSGSQATAAQKLMPVLAQIDLMRGVVSEGSFSAAYWAAGTLVMLMIGLAAIGYAIWRLSDEHILSTA